MESRIKKLKNDLNEKSQILNHKMITQERLFMTVE